MAKPPILMIPNPKKPSCIHTNASGVGLGAVLNQINEDGKEHPIAYANHKLKSAETHYSTVEKECLAVVWTLKFFEHYLYGQAFTVITDHRPLTWLQTMKNSNQRLMRWVVTLQQFKLNIQN